ncbi:MAG: hypothetical protein L0I95_08690, partial [Tetragenococcus koreensis]|nr:hypothetical protein [Tetragenococcus koreensis]MDN6145900.1 hypothetical protein [Tetragenococcus koreensis]MDN6166673.1 hypothetical protein [Tetragenococcus koreensis]MDN6270015.1 hypothetical protein [Tetragenococcus koreensis]MDN6288843.1 hypothetical protein [Tetragenococcus koreensis]
RMTVNHDVVGSSPTAGVFNGKRPVFGRYFFTPRLIKCYKVKKMLFFFRKNATKLQQFSGIMYLQIDCRKVGD